MYFQTLKAFSPTVRENEKKTFVNLHVFYDAAVFFKATKRFPKTPEITKTSYTIRFRSQNCLNILSQCFLKDNYPQKQDIRNRRAKN